jgi:hypothetical protein
MTVSRKVRKSNVNIKLFTYYVTLSDFKGFRMNSIYEWHEKLRKRNAMDVEVQSEIRIHTTCISYFIHIISVYGLHYIQTQFTVGFVLYLSLFGGGFFVCVWDVPYLLDVGWWSCQNITVLTLLPTCI